MKNLKRALSLVLSTAMLLGMMVVGTGASYSDVPADNEYVEAIEVMQAVGVMSGINETEFNPEGLVTRHEAAVIMANLLDLEVADFETAVVPFNDVAAWATPYVAACYSDGIMAGVGNGAFGGEQKITAAQMALMLMKALGYFQFQNDFGDDWMLATVREASKIELFDDVNTSATANLTRGQVAQMCLNALESDIVDWEGDLGTSVALPDGTTVVSGYNIKYVAEKATSKSDDYTDDDAGDDYIQLVEDLFDEDLKKSDEADEFGRPATKWEWENEEVGTYSDKADKTYTDRVTKATVYDVLGKDLYKDLFTADEDDAKDLTVWVDGADSKIGRSEEAVKAWANKNDTGKINQRASTVEIYIDDDTKDVDIVIINTYVVQASDDYSAKNETVKIDTLHNSNIDDKELDVDDFPMIENVSEDDYLLVTVADKEIQTVKMAEVITGRVNTYTKADTVTIDGVKYNYAATACTDDENGKAVSYSVGEDATVVLADGHIIYVDEAAVAADKYVYIAEIKDDSQFNDDDAEFIAKAYFLDGTKKTINIKDEFKNPKTDVKGGESGWFTYSVNNNDVYTLYQIDAEDKAEVSAKNGVLTENRKTSLGNGSVKINSDTMFIIIDEDGDVCVYTGVKSVPTIEGVTTEKAYVVVDGSYAEYVFIDAEDCKIDESTSSDDFLFILKPDSVGIDADDNEYFVYKAILNGEATKVSLNYELATAEAYMTLWADVEYDSDGYIDSMSEIELGDEDYEFIDTFEDAVVDFEKDVLVIDDESFVLADEAQLILVACDSNIKSDDGEAAEVYSGITGKQLANECDDYECTGKYWAQMNDDDELTALYLVITKTAEI